MPRYGNNFSLAKNKAGIYFCDGEGRVSWTQQNDPKIPIDPRLMAAIKAAWEAFTAAYYAPQETAAVVESSEATHA